ncbi:uncharacterized protein LOC144915950 isoform X2 [Branchiostoma floridae x Branchiostoma belcheri]
MDPRRPPAYGPSVGFPSIPSWNLQYPSRPVGVRDPSNLTYATEGLLVTDSRYWPPPFCYGFQPPDVYRFNHSERSPFSPIQQTANNMTTAVRPSTSKEASAHRDIATRRINNFMRGIKREDRMRVYQDFMRCIKARRENNRKRQKSLSSDKAAGATDPAEPTSAETSQELPGAAEVTPELPVGTEPPASHEMPGVTEPTPEVSGGTEPPAGHEMPGAAGPTHDLPGGTEPTHGPQYWPPPLCYGVQPPEVYRFDHSERSPFSPVQQTTNNMTTTARPPTIKAASADQDTSARIIYNALLRNIVREKDLTSMKSVETKLTIEEFIKSREIKMEDRKGVRQDFRECIKNRNSYRKRRQKKLSSNQAARAVEPTLDLPGVAESTHEMPRTAEPTHELPRAAEPTHERPGAAEPTHELPRAAETTHKLPRAAEPIHELPRAAEPTPKLPSKSRRNSPRAAAESRRTSSRVAESRRTSSRVAERRRTSSRVAESHRTNSRAVESRRTNSRAAEPTHELPRDAEPTHELPRAAEPTHELPPRAAEAAYELPRAAEPAHELPRAAEPAHELPRAAEPAHELPRATEPAHEMGPNSRMAYEVQEPSSRRFWARECHPQN